MDTKIPRGIRNNNPLNIRIGNRWQGEVENPTDTEFEQFISMKWGLRAAFILLKRYIERYRLNTIRDIISRWAPSTENNTRRYIEQVCRWTDMPEDRVLDFNNSGDMTMLVWAMARVETGYSLDFSELIDAYDMV